MMYFIRTFLTVSLIILIACSSVSYKSDFDKSIDFTTYKNYTLYQGEISEDELSRNPLVKKRIIESVEQVLQDKGFVKVDSSSADFTVVIHAGADEQMQIYNTGGIAWYDPWWGTAGSRTDVDYQSEGTLIIDLVDANKKELSWRSTASAVVKDYKNAAEMQKFFDEVIQRMLEEFPPE